MDNETELNIVKLVKGKQFPVPVKCRSCAYKHGFLLEYLQTPTSSEMLLVIAQGMLRGISFELGPENPKALQLLVPPSILFILL